jgi:4-diphosphocytidyl-2-C-methyl-D-erythritol kinase
LTKRENDIKLSCNFNSLDEIVSALENDLEETAASICPQIKRLKEMLILHGAKGALMSGSGSSVFGCFESKEKAERAAKNLLSYGRVFVARSIGRHSWK